jgi:hypothetical protein
MPGTIILWPQPGAQAEWSLGARGFPASIAAVNIRIIQEIIV